MAIRAYMNPNGAFHIYPNGGHWCFELDGKDLTHTSIPIMNPRDGVGKPVKANFSRRPKLQPGRTYVLELYDDNDETAVLQSMGFHKETILDMIEIPIHHITDTIYQENQ